MSAAEPVEYTEVRLSVARDRVDLVSDYIVEHITNGMVLEDEEDSPEIAVIFYLSSSDENRNQQLSELQTFLNSLGDKGNALKSSLKFRSINNIEWIEIYRKSVTPVRVGEDVVIRPPWHSASGAKYEIIIEPRMAFGTGTHGSTRGCLRAILSHFSGGGRFLDLGCGSGILSILAAKMGAAYIKAIDYDVVAVENCRENFEANEVNCDFKISHGSIEQCAGDPAYEFVCVNIIRSTILEMIEELARMTETGGTLVLSGLLEQDLDEIRSAAREAGLNERDSITVDEWFTLVMV